MNCHNIRKKIQLYVDGTLMPKDLYLIEKHLQECRECKKEYNSYYRLVNELNKMECPLPSEEEWERIHEGIIKGISLITPAIEKKIISLPLWRVTSSYNRIRAVAALILLSLISFGGFKIFYKNSGEQKIVAEVLEVNGRAVTAVDKSEVIKPKLKILAGRMIITEEDATLNLRIEKSVVRVGKSSQLKLAELGREKTEIELLEGDVNALVSKRKSSQLFRIRTPNAVCEVVGNKFNVSTQYDPFHKKYITTLTVDEGIVKFGRDGNKVEVGAGKGIALFGDSLGSIMEKNDSLIVQLIKLKGKGYIYISSLPESAKVFINKEVAGYT
ncbi:MAG: FecR domain-containing protein, partial [Chitinispirillaceae bacterium]|nr:FecR domain-containing protein [Chitinispirillaceae bacterium]